MSTAWMTRANCIGVDPELFHPEKGSSIRREALAACAGCSVQQECRDYAAANNLSGVWGGTSESQRKGRSKRDQNFCRNGHPRTVENTKVGSTGRRRCRDCLIESGKRAYRLRKAKLAAERRAANAA